VTSVNHRALELLQAGTLNPKAQFREGQLEAIEFLMGNKGRLLVVQKTGWGKSSVYFISAKLLRERKGGVTLLVSPLLALMRNQLAAAERMGLNAVTINSSNQEDWEPAKRKLLQDKVDILIISPERFANAEFSEEVMQVIAPRVNLLVVDEAHCISDWGHDFRPHYRLLSRVIKFLPPTLPLLATTATANDRVMEDLQQILGPNLTVMKGALDRPSLTLQTIRLHSQAERLAWLSENVRRVPGSGIIYTLTKRDAFFVAAWLRSEGLDVEAYVGGGENRDELEDKLQVNKLKGLVATTALGMGYDKPDLAFVFHYQMPGSVVLYYQQVGRAGRGLSNAYGVLLQGGEDAGITDWFINSAFPKPQEVEGVLNRLALGPRSVDDLLSELNLSKGSIQKVLEMLNLESPAPIVKNASKWVRTSAPLSNEFWERTKRLTNLRKDELDQMVKYVELPFGSHMAYLMDVLDSPPALSNQQLLAPLPEKPSLQTVHRAVEFLRRSDLPIPPRKKWPSGGLPAYNLRGNIPPQFQNLEGRALSVWGDGGWGAIVKRGRYEDNYFDDNLVRACAEMVRKWKPSPQPAWVTPVPSLRHPELVPSFAKRLAKELGLPYQEALEKTVHSKEQKSMANATQQARNVDGSMKLDRSKMLSGPVLLVDDIVNSRWTYTIAGWLLASNGCPAVLPVALAVSGADE
jgi:ATP-dependent DNA helicase RecQ